MILITGAAGFIGLNFLHLVKKNFSLNDEILVVDKLTYASHPDAIKTFAGITFAQVDIADKDSLKKLFQTHQIKSIINFAAESHVDNSIKDCMPFVYSNIIGTINLLQLGLEFGIEKFLQISTDEVFGEVTAPDSFSELSKISPKNPYSASKASAEHFVEAFKNTYGLNTLIVNCSNNYGPYQYKEKLIPLAVTNLLDGKKVPVYGNGKQVRDWIYVEDACRAILRVFESGKPGERYCIGGDCAIENINLVKLILNELNLGEDRIEYVKDRPGHDLRYHTDCTKIKNELNWQPLVSLETGIKETVEWYCENRI